MKFKVLHFSSLCSTQDTAKQLGKKGHFDLAVVAKNQTEGRGRMQRKWHSDSGNLYMSILLRPSDMGNLQHLTLAGAIAVSNVLKKEKINTKIKWPNDIHYIGKKLCGILTEVSFGDKIFAVVGIGLNVNQNKFVNELEKVATSMKIICKKTYDIDTLAKSILAEFGKLYTLYEKGELGIIRKIWVNKSNTIGRNIEIRAIGKTIRGKAIGINKDCSLKVQTENEVIDIYEGDVSIRY